MLRAYCKDWDGGAELPELGREEMHHLVRVRRVRVGEPIEILNGRGHVGQARVMGLDKRRAEFSLGAIQFVSRQRLHIHLLVALPKGKTFPALLHKAVELGVSVITPVVTDNVEVAPERADEKRDHWQAVLIEGIKQSGNPWIPELRLPVPLKNYLNRKADGQRLCAALEPDAKPLWQLLGNPLEPEGELEIFVGPEGDFSREEYGQLREGGCLFATLGPLVLKVETAASLIVGVIQVWANGNDP